MSVTYVSWVVYGIRKPGNDALPRILTQREPVAPATTHLRPKSPHIILSGS